MRERDIQVKTMSNKDDIKMEFLPTVLDPGSLKIDTKNLKKKLFVLETDRSF